MNPSALPRSESALHLTFPASVSLGFLNPLVLIGLAAAAIPILIHLFNFRRPRRVDFPSLRFVRELERKAMRRVRLRQWLLLALRTLAITALVVAFARPVLPSAWRSAFGARPPAAVALVVDNSLSMTARDARGAYMDQARAVASAIADAAPTGDALALLSTAGAWTERLHPTREPVLDQLETLQAAPGASPLTTAAARAAALLGADERPRREVYLITDLQASTLIDSTARLERDVRLTLVPIGEGSTVNTAVTDVRLESDVIEPGRPVRLVATLSRWGGDAGPVTARVFLEGEAVAEASARVEPGRPSVVRFVVTPTRPGWQRGEVRLAEGDAYRGDDARSFVVETPAARRVLLVRGEGRGTEFVRLALGLGAETGSIVVNEVEEAALPGADLSSVDAVVLVGPRTVGTTAARALASYIQSGGGVMLFPAGVPGEGAYSGLIQSVGGGRFIGFHGSPGGEVIGTLGDVDLEHPLLDGLLADGAAGRLEGPEVRAALRYQPGGGDETTIARLSMGTPFLHEIRRGRGVLLLVTVSPDPQWGDLASRGLFAPLVLRSVAYLASAGASPGGAPQALLAGRPGTLRLEGVDLSSPFTIVAPDGIVIDSEPRLVPGAVLLDVDAPARTGVYTVRQGDNTLLLVPVNTDPAESDLRRLSPEDAVARLEQVAGTGVTMLDARGAAGEAALTRRGAGAPLWTIALVVALLALAAETIVATRWRVEST